MDRKIKSGKRIRRHKRVRAKICGTSKVPRLCVFKSNKHIYAQLIDDKEGKTLAAASDQELKSKVKGQRSKIQVKNKKIEKENKVSLKGKITVAYEVGKLIAQKAEEKKIKKVVFDRGGFKYHGRVKALAQGARENNLKF